MTHRFTILGRFLGLLGSLVMLGACGAAVTQDTGNTPEDGSSPSLQDGALASPSEVTPAPDAATLSPDVVPTPPDAAPVQDTASASDAVARPEATPDAAPRDTSGPPRWVTVRAGGAAQLEGVWASDPENVWVVGSSGTTNPPGLILRSQGGVWGTVTLPTGASGRAGFHDVWGTGPHDLWVVGGFPVSSEGQALHWNGRNWTSREVPANTVWGSGPNDVWFAGGYGAVYQFDGSTWRTFGGGGGRAGVFDVFFRGRITDMWSVDGSAWFVGDAVQQPGTVVRRSPEGSFTSMVAAARDLRGVWASSADEAWAVGAAGLIVRWNGSTWWPVESGTRENLVAVWGSSATNVWAVGTAGTILHWQGRAWVSVPSGSTQDLLAVWGLGPNDVWAVGAGGTILHWPD